LSVSVDARAGQRSSALRAESDGDLSPASSVTAIGKEDVSFVVCLELGIEREKVFLLRGVVHLTVNDHRRDGDLKGVEDWLYVVDKRIR
jgi:hypothetical protein